MQALTSTASSLLLSPKDKDDSHSIRKSATGPASTFASYTFGPMDLPDAAGGAQSGAARKAVTGAAPAGISSTDTGGASTSAGFLAQLSAMQMTK